VLDDVLAAAVALAQESLGTAFFSLGKVLGGSLDIQSTAVLSNGFT